MTRAEILREIERCDREIAAAQDQPGAPAYLVTLGIEDWWHERRLLEQMLVDPETGIRPMDQWGNACYQGFVSDARFGSGQVIKRTNRNTTRKWIRSGERSLFGQAAAGECPK